MRKLRIGFAATLLALVQGFSAQSAELYGLIGKMIAVPGQRDAFIEILLEGTEEMPGCLSYIVAKDAADPNAIWISEVWDSKASHAASLSLPAVKAAIAKGRPLIAGMGEGAATIPVGGLGISGLGTSGTGLAKAPAAPK